MTLDPSKYRDAYLTEAKAHIRSMNNALLELEKKPTDPALFHEIFRAVHTLKSLAATMNYQETATLTHSIEDVLDNIRNNAIPLSKCFDSLFRSFDFLSMNLQKVEANEPEISTDMLVDELKRLSENISNNAYYDNKLKNPIIETSSIEKIKAVEVKVERLDTLLNLAEGLLVAEMKLDAISSQIDSADLNTAVESLSRLISELQYNVLQARLVPIDYIFNRFPRMVRDLAKDQKKQIDLIIEGSDIELDRFLIDEIGESIMHLVRNAVDHGLETPSVRKKNGKPAEGKLLLRAIRSKESALIEIADDGSGVDLKSVKEIAIKHKIIKNDATTEEILNTIFFGLSTTAKVTSISGRGLGLGIVKQKIESIGGTIRVQSTQKQGTTFFIEIPLTLAIIKTLFIKVSKDTYALPLESVDRLLIMDATEIKGMMEQEAIIFEGEDIPLIRLSRLFGTKQIKLEKQPIVIIHKGDERVGLIVDALLATQEVIIKPLSSTAKESKFFSGAAMIGSGAMILILDTTALLSSKKEAQYS